MKTIGIKLADGSFYPIMQEGSAEKRKLNLTTVKDNQTTVQVDLYRSESGTMQDAEYVDSLEIKNLVKHPNGEPDISLDISLDENNELKAELHDPETGKDSTTTVYLVSRSLEQRSEPSEVTEAITEDSNEDNLDDFSSDLDFDAETFDLDQSLSSEPQETFDSDDDLTFDPNTLNVDSIVEEETSTETEEVTKSTELPETSESEDLFNDDFDNSGSAGLDFSDILDEETKEGYAGTADNESCKKKVKVPVIICIVCAVICILAVLLMLFVIPTSFNILKKPAKEPVKVEQPAPVVVEEEKKEEPKYEAKEDEIVVAPAEEVVPEVPAKDETESKNITYKIKWGDTLWDISKSYYNNPWKYPKIAKYNGIKNPDHIISGTKIIIPAE